MNVQNSCCRTSLWSVLKDLIKSKKCKTAVIGGIIVVIKVAGLKGIVLDVETAKGLAEMVFGLASAYILAQGVADFGKSKQALLSGAFEIAKTAGAEAPAEAPAEAAKEETAPTK